VTVDALFAQAGVIRTDTLHELFNVAALLAKQPIPRGDRIAIVTNGGGPGIICADACQADGVRVPEPTPALRAELARLIPEAASLGNPVDLLAAAAAQDYGQAVRALADSEEFDAIVTIFVPPLVTEAEAVAAAISEAGRDCGPCTPGGRVHDRRRHATATDRGRSRCARLRVPRGRRPGGGTGRPPWCLAIEPAGQRPRA
jgi:acyl-CoA synthetase (NDP forming)